MANKTAGSKSKKKIKKNKIIPFFKTIEQMAVYSGIGENTLRELVASGEIEFIQVGSKKLLADEAMWRWYNEKKTRIKKAKEKESCFMIIESQRKVE